VRGETEGVGNYVFCRNNPVDEQNLDPCGMSPFWWRQIPGWTAAREWLSRKIVDWTSSSESAVVQFVAGQVANQVAPSVGEVPDLCSVVAEEVLELHWYGVSEASERRRAEAVQVVQELTGVADFVRAYDADEQYPAWEQGVYVWGGASKMFLLTVMARGVAAKVPVSRCHSRLGAVKPPPLSVPPSTGASIGTAEPGVARGTLKDAVVESGRRPTVFTRVVSVGKARLAEIARKADITDWVKVVDEKAAREPGFLKRTVQLYDRGGGHVGTIHEVVNPSTGQVLHRDFIDIIVNGAKYTR
jgi:hypothetical protein